MEKVSTNLTKRCKKCGEDREIALFKYKLSKAEARARGYSGERLVELEGKTCNLCKPQPRALSAKRNAELRQMVDAGDLNELKYEQIINARAEKASIRKAQAKKRYWEKLHAVEWADHTKQLRHEIKLVTNQCENAMRNGAPKIEVFARAYLKVLMRIQAQLQIREGNGEKVDPAHDWRKDATDTEYDEIETLESVIPNAIRMRMRTAMLLTLKPYKRGNKVLEVMDKVERRLQPLLTAQVGDTVEKLDTSWLEEL